MNNIPPKRQFCFHGELIAAVLGLVCCAGLIGQSSGPSWTISKSHNGNFTQGQQGAAYTISVSNVGFGIDSPTGFQITVTEQPPSGLSVASMSGTGWSCSQPTCSRTDPISGPSGSYPPITVTVNVDPNAPANVTNVATVQCTTSVCNDQSVHTANDPTTINQRPSNWTISKSHSGNFTQGQQGATYTVSVANTGPGIDSASGFQIVVTEMAPPGLTVTKMSGSGWSCITLPTCTRTDPISGPSGVYPPITVTVNVDPNAPGSVTNVATVECTTEGCSDTALHTASDPTTINAGGPTFITATPQITALAASVLAATSPAFAPAITSGTPIPGFKLYVLGSNFDVNQITVVNWFDPTTNTTTALSNVSVLSTNEIVATVPSSLFSKLVSSPVNVQVTVQQSLPGTASPAVGPRVTAKTGTSNAGIFVINPPLASLGPTLPSGQVGIPYAQPYFTGGSGPFQERVLSGALPNGLSFSSDGSTISGTPTTIGTFPFQVQIFDVWGNVIAPNDSIQITAVTPPTISSITPNNAPACSPATTITVNGSNFIPSSPSNLAVSFQGSQVIWTASGGSPIALATTYVSSTQLTAIIPSNLLGTPLTATITVSQPSPAGSAPLMSNGVPFTVGAPTIIGFAPSGVTAGSPTITLVINGANFVNINPQAASQVIFNGTGLVTTFVNSGQLTVSINASLLAQPGSYPVYVLSPCGAKSNTVTFTVFPTSTVTSLNPSSVFAGSPAFPLTVTGTNFNTGLSIVFGGTRLSSTCVNPPPASAAAVACASNQLVATVPANLVTTPGTVTVTVVTADGITVIPGLPFQIIPRLQITAPASLPPGAPGVAYSVQVTATGGTAPLSWAATGLPAGININPTTGLISGTTSLSGSFPVTVTVSDASGQVASAQYTLAIVGKLTITTVSLPGGVVGVAYSTTITTSGGLAPITISATGVPAGLAQTGAVLGGVPTTAGTFPITFTARDSSGQTATVTLNLIIGPKLTITTASLPNGSVGVGYSATVTAIGGVPPITWSATLPAGLSINASTGVISGTPTTAGAFTATIRASDTSGQTATASIPLNIVSPLIITSGNPGPATAGASYVFQLTASGGTPPYTWSVTGLAPGLSVNPQTGLISGTPTAASNGTVNIKVTDSTGQIAMANYTFSTAPAPPPPLQIVTPSLPDGVALAPYATSVAATGGTPDYIFSLAGGSLPPGVNIQGSGAISGTPTTPGTYNVTIRVTDSTGATASRGYSILIKPAPITVTGSVNDLLLNASFSFKFGATGGIPPFTFSASGTIPGGKFTSDGTLSGTATNIGTFSFSVTATDSQGNTGTKSFTVNVTAPPLVITTASIPPAAVGVPYSASFAAQGGVPPYTFSGGGAPDGLTFNGANLSGSPTSDGTFTISVTVTDSVGTKATKSFGLTVAPLLQITTTSLAQGTVGVGYGASLSASGGVPPYSFSASGLPDGLSVSTNGSISGTPTTAGNSSVTATVTDANGTKATKTFGLTVVFPPITVSGTPPGGTVGTAYSFSFTATGGAPPYTFSASGLPAGLVISSGGAVSGTPTAAGTSNVTVTVTDSQGNKGTASASINVVLPPAPNVTVTGAPPTANASDQEDIKVSLDRSFPVAVTVTLTLTVNPVSGPPPQDVQFANGGQTFSFVVPANTPAATPTDVFLQVGTVAGTITVTEKLTIDTQDVTPTPTPSQTITIAPGVPVLTGNPSMTATRNSTGFTVVATGYSNTREIQTALFQFTAASGQTVQTNQISIPGSQLFAPYYSSAASNATGGSFKLTQAFTITGNTQAIVSVTLTLTNSVGSSKAVTVNLQ